MTPHAPNASHAGPELSWIVPMYRTATCLEDLLCRIAETARRMKIAYEIVLVDDACPEGSGAAAEGAARTRPEVRVIRLPRNLGQDGALRAGLRACLGGWAVLLDADLQDPPEAVAELWAKRSSATDAVLANRTGRYTSPGRHLTSRIYRRTAALLSGLPRGACLFALLNRRLIDHVAATRREPISILAAIASARGSCHIVPIARSTRPSGRSSYTPSRRATKALQSLWQMFLGRRLGVRL